MNLGDSGGPLLNYNGKLISMIVVPFQIRQVVGSNGIDLQLSKGETYLTLANLVKPREVGSYSIRVLVESKLF